MKANKLNFSTWLIVAVSISALLLTFIYLFQTEQSPPSLPEPNPLASSNESFSQPEKAPTSLMVQETTTELDIRTQLPTTATITPAASEPNNTKPAEPIVLNNSDSAIKAMLLPLAGKLLTEQSFSAEIARKAVAFVDSLSLGQLNHKVSPINLTLAPFTGPENQNQYIPASSYQRYEPLANTLSALTREDFFYILQQFAPILDQAYLELGYNEGEFLDTLYQTNLMLIDSPMPAEPIAITKHIVTYKYKDPQLEALSDAQKWMVRVGPHNRAKINQALAQMNLAIVDYQNQ